MEPLTESNPAPARGSRAARPGAGARRGRRGRRGRGRGACAALVALLTVSVCAGTSEGTTVKALSDAELCAAAAEIFHGVCVGARPELDAKGRIVTRYRFQVQEGFKGVTGATTELVQPGGTLNGRSLIVPGAASFRAGEEVVAFVGRACPRTGCSFTVGLAQGKFSVSVDPRTGVRVASRDLSELHVLHAAAGGVPPAGSQRGGQTLAELRDTIRRHLR